MRQPGRNSVANGDRRRADDLKLGQPVALKFLPKALAIEVKAKANVAARDLKSLRALAEEQKLRRFLCVSLEPRRRVVDGIQVLPIRDFLEALWAGQFR